jgi:hypothetical protein
MGSGDTLARLIVLLGPRRSGLAESGTELPLV